MNAVKYNVITTDKPTRSVIPTAVNKVGKALTTGVVTSMLIYGVVPGDYSPQPNSKKNNGVTIDGKDYSVTTSKYAIDQDMIEKNKMYKVVVKGMDPSSYVKNKDMFHHLYSGAVVSSGTILEARSTMKDNERSVNINEESTLSEQVNANNVHKLLGVEYEVSIKGKRNEVSNLQFNMVGPREPKVKIESEDIAFGEVFVKGPRKKIDVDIDRV